ESSRSTHRRWRTTRRWSGASMRWERRAGRCTGSSEELELDARERLSSAAGTTGKPSCLEEPGSRPPSVAMGGSGVMLHLGEKQVDGPTAAHMRAWGTAVGHDYLVGATGPFQYVSQHRQPLKVQLTGRAESFVVTSPGELDDVTRGPADRRSD